MKMNKLKRRTNFRELRRILVVCEGEKTEPNYFKKFPANPAVYDDINILGLGYNTVSLVREAIRLKTEAKMSKQPYIEVWCVFDKDDYTFKQLQDAIGLAGRNQIKCAYSIEAFELWYMLHFNFYDSALSRKEYEEKLTKLLGRTYKKNDSGLYGVLFRRQKTAIKNAKKLYELKEKLPFSQQDPITTVFELVEKLS